MSFELSLQNILKNATLLKGHRDAIDVEKDKIYQDVEKAKKWLAKKPDYLKFLQHLQHVLHKKNIGIFSELLTYFVKDVLHKDKEIALDLYTYHNLPALRIEAMNNGHRESIYEGNGGSIANIVSTGLRLISLSRMTNRKFIILDEPDCWLAPQHIPLFAKIIGEISQKLRIQTVLISHHSWEYFKSYGRVIELKKDGAHLSTTILHDTAVDNYPDDYITDITLRRFMSHYDTTYQLHPYLTCIVGENDIGKSVIAPAMKALSYGDSSDSYIMHNESEAQVVVNTSQDIQFLWQRFLATSQDNPQKVKFSWFKQNVLQHSEFNAHEAPEFISDKLKIAMTEDIDIHIGNQKQPVFLLSSDVKPQERAKILSLGKESLTIQKMMETIKTKTRSNQQIIKEGEAKYDKILKQLKHLSDIDTLIAKAEQALGVAKKQIEQKSRIKELKDFLPEYENLLAIENVDIISYQIELPELHNTEELNYLIEEFEVNEKISSLDKIETIDYNLSLNNTGKLQEDIRKFEDLHKIAQIEKVSLMDYNLSLSSTDKLQEDIRKFEALQSMADVEKIQLIDSSVSLHDGAMLERDIADLATREKILHLKPIQLITVSSLHEKEELLRLIAQYEEAENNLKLLKIKGLEIEKDKNSIDKEIEEFLAQSDNKCPTCGQHLDTHSVKEHIND